MKYLKIFGVTSLIIGVSLLGYWIFDYIKKLKNEITFQKNTHAEIPKITATNQNYNDYGKIFLGKRIANFSPTSLNTQSKLFDIPAGSNYAILYMIDCEIEYNQDGDFENGSPKSNHTITIDSNALMSNFNYKVKFVKSNSSRIYIEYYH